MTEKVDVPPLPDDYSFAAYPVSHADVNSFMQAATKTKAEFYLPRQVRHVGVLNGRQQLVGIGGIYGYRDLPFKFLRPHAVLDHLFVTPEERGRGIGKALIARRVEIAEADNAKDIWVPQLAPTNTLASYYCELGFVESRRGSLLRRF